MRCSGCGGDVDGTATRCPACGNAVDLGRLTGLLGRVCRACDAYNDPGARACVACGALLVAGAATPAPAAPLPPASGSHDAPVVRHFPVAAPASAPGAVAAPPPAPAAPDPAPRARATLYLERGAAADGAAYRLDAGELAAGRGPGPMSFPDDPCLAPHHATFLLRGDAPYVRDVGAPGGVLLRLRGLSVPLRAGDHFAIGDRLLRYAGPLAPPAAPHGAGGTHRLGAPRPPAGAIALEESLEGAVPGRVFVRAGPAIRIGRSGCAVTIDDPTVAPAHAELILDGEGGARLRDLGTPGGTYLRLPPHAERELRDGDRVRLGREILRIALG